MLNKSFGVLYFHFNIFSEKAAKKTGVNFYIFGFLKMCPRSVHSTLQFILFCYVLYLYMCISRIIYK